MNLIRAITNLSVSALIIALTACAEGERNDRPLSAVGTSPNSEATATASPSAQGCTPGDPSPFVCFERTGHSVIAEVQVEEDGIIHSEGRWTCFELKKPGTLAYSMEAEGGELAYRSAAPGSTVGNITIQVVTSSGTTSVTQAILFTANRPMTLLRLFQPGGELLADYQHTATITGEGLSECRIEVVGARGVLG